MNQSNRIESNQVDDYHVNKNLKTFHVDTNVDAEN
jgi:hypothetical protein